MNLFGVCMSKRVDNFSEASFIYEKTLNGLGGPTIYGNHCILSYQVESGTTGYTTPTAAWTPVQFNTVLRPARSQTSYVVLSPQSNGIFRLEPGVYHMRGEFTLGSGSSGDVGNGKVRLHDLNRDVILSYGLNFYGDAPASNTHIHFLDTVKLLRPTRMRFETYVDGSNGSIVQYASSIADTPEVYNSLHLYRIGNSGGTLGV